MTNLTDVDADSSPLIRCYFASLLTAQPMVAGRYGHSRLLQWALGGLTRDLLSSAHLLVLFSQ